MARNSVKIGIIMLIAWIIPLVGLILAIIGLVTGAISYADSKSVMARAGIFLNSLGLGLAMLNIIVTFYLFLSGDFDPTLLLEQLEQVN